MGREWDTFDGRPVSQVNNGKYHNASTILTSRGATIAATQKAREPFIAFLTAALSECLRIAKPGARLLCWAIPRTSHWTGTAIEDAGWVVEGKVLHVFGQGFPKGKSQLKPAYEEWWKARKPLNCTPVEDTIEETYLLLEVWLWLNSPAGLAAALSELGRQPPELGDTAAWLVTCMSIAESGDESVLTGMFKSPEEGSTFWSIVSLWSSILAASSDGMSTFTTETATRLITALRTLNSFLSATIPENITQAVLSPNGPTPSVTVAGSPFDDSRRRWQDTHAPSATAPVMVAVLNTLASVAASLSLAIGTSPAGIVRATATTAPPSPAMEDWWLARKPGGRVLPLQVDACRVGGEIPPSVPRGRFVGSNNNHRTEGRNGEMSEPHPGGRWPSNLVLSHAPGCVRLGVRRVRVPRHRDGYAIETSGHWGLSAQNGTADNRDFSDPDGTEAVADFACAPGCPIGILNRQAGHLHGSGNKSDCGAGADAAYAASSYHVSYAGRASRDYGAAGGHASRFFPCFDPEPDEALFRYVPKASRSDRGEGNRHPTTKSQALTSWLCRLITPPGGCVLDPFAGSGTTGVACLAEGFDCILIEREPEYLEIIRHRLGLAQPTRWDGRGQGALDLFADSAA